MKTKDIEEMIKKKAYNYQLDALKWAGDKPRPAFFMEMRLGKTLVAIRWAKQFSFKKTLVVCFLSVAPVWQEELACEGKSSAMLIGSWKEKWQILDDQDVHWYITNFESTYVDNRPKKPKASIITQLPWDCVIIDESTGIRNPTAIRTKMCCKQFKLTPYRSILTGLPDPESKLDYFQQMAFLDGQFMGCESFWEFRNKFFHQVSYDWIPNKGTLSKIKEAVNKNAFVLTRKQAGIGSKKIYEKRYVELPSKVRKEYRSLERNFCLGIEETKWTIVVKVWLARLAGGQPENSDFCSMHKFHEILYLLNSELRKEQGIIWFRFNLELIYIHHMLEMKGISNDFITGEVAPTERERTRKRFNQGKFRWLLAQIKCSKFGIDCSAASVAIYYSNSFAYEERAQSEDRIISPKKKESVLILDILTKNTVDEDIYKALKDKKVNAKTFNSKILENLRKRVRSKNA